MTDDECQRILDEAYASIERGNDVERDLEQRRLGIGHFAQSSSDDRERERLAKMRAAQPLKPEPRLDTALPDIAALIETKIAEALASEREYLLAVIAETLALERRDTEAFLSGATTAFRGELANLQNALAELRDVLANEAKRGADVQRARSLLDFPARDYPRDLN